MDMTPVVLSRQLLLMSISNPNNQLNIPRYPVSKHAPHLSFLLEKVSLVLSLQFLVLLQAKEEDTLRSLADIIAREKH